MARPEPGTDLLPIHFGAPGDALFGCYHAPAAETARDAAVVLCYPFGQEYIRAHRAFVLLGRRLARRGFHVLRFDYYGSGDSPGVVEDVQLSRWLEDTSTAIDEARRRSGARRVSLVGLRLGGSLAAMAATDRGDIADLALWDPVIDGRAYVAELARLQADLLRYEYVTVEDAAAVGAAEALGFPLTSSLREQLAGLDLTRLPRPAAERILLVESGRPPGTQRFRDRLAPATSFEHMHVPGPCVWLTETFQGIVPQDLLEVIISWLDRVRP
jgi:uncharacterized protein